LFDASADSRFANLILETIGRKRHHRGIRGVVAGSSMGALSISGNGALEARALTVEQSNSSIAFGSRYILKCFRRVEDGISPDLEIGRFLSANASYAHAPTLAGWLEYRIDRNEPRTLAVLQQFVPNQGDAWSYACNELDRYFERASVQQTIPPLPEGSIPGLVGADGPDAFSSRMIGAFLEAARLLGRRVAELHLALATPTDDTNFALEAFTPFWHRSVYQSLRNLAGQNLRLLRSQLGVLSPEDRLRAERLLEHPEWVEGRFEGFLRQPLSSMRIRCHGDLHLGQVLYTGNDFFIIDFEGEPARPLGERRRKRSAVRDLAGMIRSFDYAASSTLLEMVGAGSLAGQDFASMHRWAVLWQRWTSALFLKEYLEVAAAAPFAPQDRKELQVLLDAFVLEKAIYELGYELNNRPAWAGIPLRGIESVLGVESD
jgi:maltose alpha-D-glucosyltransferase/alpha-amylase